MKNSPKYTFDLSPAENWFTAKGWQAFPFQKKTWQAYLAGKSGLLNAPTGSGKTYAVWLGCVLEAMQSNTPAKGLQIIWVTPLRALAKDICAAMREVNQDLDLGWDIALRTGDTTQAERQRQKRNMPQTIVTTPESIHILLSQKDAKKTFGQVKSVIVDEWHELIGGKRGVQVELALAFMRHLKANPIKTWAISATIGNLEEAAQVLLGDQYETCETIRANVDKKIEIESILPKTVKTLPWAGHLGIHLLPQIVPILENHTSTLMFTNVRSQTEIWYQKMMQNLPEYAGLVAMHHGSLDIAVRQWVEDRLHTGKLKCVVCTSSLDLGVDFRPVDMVIQVGGPKGVARFFQRAGRSGHQPGATSKVYFLPTHSLELIEAAVLKEAIDKKQFESRVPLRKCFDVLVQYLVTLAVGPGFYEKETFDQIKSTHAYEDLTPKEWQWCLEFITTGGRTLSAYDEYSKVEIAPDGQYKVSSRKTAMRHRMSMGTIVSDPMVKVKYQTGSYIGTVEELFIAGLRPGDTFWFAGRSLELIRVKDMTAQVRKSKRKTGPIPRWGGGKASFTSLLSHGLRIKLEDAALGKYVGKEMETIRPLLEKQRELSTIPMSNELLIEQLKSDEGTHFFIYPLEGKYIHEVLAALCAYRISVSQPISFSIASNDYGLELLTDQDINVEDFLELDLFSQENLMDDIYASLNNTEMAKRKFRDIATIAGLIFQGYPGKGITNRHLQASSSMIYKVFEDYDPDNLLMQQANEEVLSLQFEKSRLTEALERINQQEIIVKKLLKPTPLCFPIMVDRFREKFTSERLSDRIEKMQIDFD
ncbi:ligase-associated DNA damage response DEXH box helicase [Roseivirga misakiensis]|uniref:DNA ligase-associated DEXH box helicase n=1 Tax=Roseivirga misakiensis TaxID=1563681 RepID=A0A1E5T0S8_9BACT|nr:ligase-associated DNA damage response DEXH box helicase [Roseivirga misakiensis]OEK04969.1 DNA ligase-associated DEXH box helicase [Roseivirga misakiensis]